LGERYARFSTVAVWLSVPPPGARLSPEGQQGDRDGLAGLPSTARQLPACRDLGRGDSDHRRLHRRGPTRARTTINGDWIFVTLIDTLTKGERTLANNGRADMVRESRKAFQTAMRDEFVAEIEGLTGRQVTAFLSDNHIEPDVAIEAFQLTPAADA
jgi:uncharacterized protein YbcI